MKKTAVILFALLLLLSACKEIVPNPSGRGASPAVSSPAASPAVSSGASQGADAESLKALLPDKAGFQWQYFGFAEYAMTMSLKSIKPSGTGTQYDTEGKVADMSGGSEASGDFTVKITYMITPGILSRKLSGSKAMDSPIPDIELIRTPLAEGTKWEQNVKLDGKDAALDCEITGVKSANGRKTYSVAYRQRGSDYYELRDITEGLGVTSFQKLYKYDTGSDLIGYWLNMPGAQSTMGDYKQWLPALDKQYTYFGLAEYGHKGRLVKASGDDKEDAYEYRGVYADGMGDESKFVIRYYANKGRGTVTEQVISNERGDAEVNSKLHNLVILKFPLSLGAKWSNQAKLNGKAVTAQAEIIGYDEVAGVVKVRYTAKGAAGYYNGTYIEDRTFEKGYGLTSFSNLIPGDIGISAADAKDPIKLEEAIRQHSFGYSMNKAAAE